MISVIIPVYNADRFLHHCIDSVLNQSYSDFELLLINDGSTDKSGNICDQYAKTDKRIRVVHTENGGVSKARNKGIELAKGDYICFIDSDDYICEHYLEELVTTALKFTDANNVWCGFQTVNGYKKPKVIQRVLFSEAEDISFSSREYIMSLHKLWLDPMPWNKLYVRSIIISHHIRFPEDLSLGEDLIFNLNYLDFTNGKIVIVNKPLNFYVQSGQDSLDNRFYPNLFEIYKRINTSLLLSISKWQCDQSQFDMYYNSCFYSYERVLRNTYHKNSTINNKKKYNRYVMKSDEFKSAFNNSTCFIHPLYKVAYRHSMCFLLRLLDTVLRLMTR